MALTFPHGRSLSAIFLYGEGHFQTQALPHAPGNVWERLAASGSGWERLNVRERLAASGIVWEYLGASGNILERLKASESVWESLRASGSV